MEKLTCGVADNILWEKEEGLRKGRKKKCLRRHVGEIFHS